jgi:hypothetical protein
MKVNQLVQFLLSMPQDIEVEVRDSWSGAICTVKDAVWTHPDRTVDPVSHSAVVLDITLSDRS